MNTHRWPALRFLDLDPGVTGVLEPFLSVLLQTTAEQTPDALRSFGRQPIPVRIGSQDFGKNVAHRLGFKHCMPSEHLEEHTHPKAHMSDL